MLSLKRNINVHNNLMINNMHHRHNSRLPLSVFFIAVYFVFYFVVMPSGMLFEKESENRLPLLLGVIMLGTAVLEGRNIGRYRVPALWFFLFSAGYLISGLWGPSGIVEAFRLLFAQIGIGLALMISVRRVRHLDMILYTILFSALLNAFYGLLFMFLGFESICEVFLSSGMVPGRDPYAMRLTGFLEDPTYCGLLLMFGYFISLHEVINRRLQKVLKFMLSAGVLLISIYLTFSRTTWISTIFGTAIYWGFYKLKLTQKQFIVMTLSFVIVVVFNDFFAYVTAQNIDRFSFLHSDSRTWLWNAYFKIAIQKPLGYGVGSIEELRNSRLLLNLIDSNARPHNMYLIIWIESGLQTLIALIALILIAVKYEWSLQQYQDPLTGKRYGALAIVTVTSLSLGIFGLGGLLNLLFLSIGLSFLTWLFVKESKLVRE
ncbi:MAG: O-antigen ligase family protein [Nitrospirota bacterium]